MVQASEEPALAPESITGPAPSGSNSFPFTIHRLVSNASDIEFKMIYD